MLAVVCRYRLDHHVHMLQAPYHHRTLLFSSRSAHWHLLLTVRTEIPSLGSVQPSAPDPSKHHISALSWGGLPLGHRQQLG